VEPHRVPVVVEVVRPLFTNTLLGRGSMRLGSDGDVVLDQHAVLQHGERAWLKGSTPSDTGG